MKMDHTYIYLSHILFFGPLLIYSGYIGDKISIKENEKYKHLFYLLISIGAIAILYHSFLLYKLRKAIK